MIRIDFQVDDVEPRGDIRDKVGRVFASLDKYTGNFHDSLKTARVRVMKRSRWGYKILFDMSLPGRKIFAEGKGNDLLKLSHDVRDQARRQIKRYKAKLSRKK